MVKTAKKFSLILLVIALVGCAGNAQQESFGQYIDSSTITTKVKADLLADKNINSVPITVNTYKDEVQLSGFVNSQQQADKAIAIAKNVKGVKSVKNNLVVKGK